MPPSRRHPLPALAIDGKTLRGSRKQGAPLSHPLSAASHRLGLTIGQVPAGAKTNEIAAVHTLLRGLPVRGWVVAVDALLTQAAIARAILAAGGDYAMVAKKNRPGLREAIATAVADAALARGRSTTATSTSDGHGRTERRRLLLTSVLAGFPLWPGQRPRRCTASRV